MNQFMRFLQNLKNLGLEHYKRYYSKYPAIVVSVDDPDKRGRIKFQCPVIFGIDYTHEVWADPADNRLAGKNTGEFFPPYIGDWVNVMFEYGDTRNPIYSGGYHAKGELSSDFTGSYPNVRGWTFKSGQKIIIDETTGKETITISNTDGSKIIIGEGNKTLAAIHASGSNVTFDSDGNISAAHNSGTDNVQIKKGEVDVNSSGDVNVNGSDVVLAGKSSTQIGSDFGETQVLGKTVQLAKGGSPIALVGISQVLSVGNLGMPVMGNIISGSSEVESS